MNKHVFFPWHSAIFFVNFPYSFDFLSFQKWLHTPGSDRYTKVQPDRVVRVLNAARKQGQISVVSGVPSSCCTWDDVEGTKFCFWTRQNASLEKKLQKNWFGWDSF